MVTTWLFWLFAILLVAAALRVITAKNPVHSALALVLAFFMAACTWMLLHAEFLAIVLVLVYVGAVMVLFLFVVMMLDVNIVPLREGFIRYLPIGLLVAVIIAVQLLAILGSDFFDLGNFAPPAAKPDGYSNPEAIGTLLFTDYLYPFEVAAAVLLVAAIAATVLTLRRRANLRRTVPGEQVKTRRADRVRLVNVESGERQ